MFVGEGLSFFVCWPVFPQGKMTHSLEPHAADFSHGEVKRQALQAAMI